MAAQLASKISHTIINMHPVSCILSISSRILLVLGSYIVITKV